MARTEVPIKRVSRLAVASFLAAESVAGDTVNGMQVVVNDGATLLWVSSTSGAPQTVDMILVATVDFQPAGPVVLTIPANTETSLIGPFPRELYGNVLEFDVSSALLSFAAFSLL